MWLPVLKLDNLWHFRYVRSLKICHCAFNTAQKFGGIFFLHNFRSYFTEWRKKNVSLWKIVLHPSPGIELFKCLWLKRANFKHSSLILIWNIHCFEWAYRFWLDSAKKFFSFSFFDSRMHLNKLNFNVLNFYKCIHETKMCRVRGVFFIFSWLWILSDVFGLSCCQNSVCFVSFFLRWKEKKPKIDGKTAISELHQYLQECNLWIRKTCQVFFYTVGVCVFAQHLEQLTHMFSIPIY